LSFAFPALEFSQKNANFKFHSVNVFFRWGGKHLQYSMVNIFRKISTKFYQNRPSFVDDVSKNSWCGFGFAVSIAVHLQNATLSFTK